MHTTSNCKSDGTMINNKIRVMCRDTSSGKQHEENNNQQIVIQIRVMDIFVEENNEETSMHTTSNCKSDGTMMNNKIRVMCRDTSSGKQHEENNNQQIVIQIRVMDIFVEENNEENNNQQIVIQIRVIDIFVEENNEAKIQIILSALTVLLSIVMKTASRTLFNYSAIFKQGNLHLEYVFSRVTSAQRVLITLLFSLWTYLISDILKGRQDESEVVTQEGLSYALEDVSYRMISSVNIFPETIRMFVHLPILNNRAEDISERTIKESSNTRH
ncbi:uncharacterized protein LOC127853963 isoform X1 [Dreissena polymorpha]|nr:uncharacterized protein LOC127853963 isoform X1 [Dreissena polymorpha]XP_052244797.1 uncharacterized protein LOC127853963 isoform X1 [Dreissena polymorpha]XP_052244798.1 uncharacterized protein LOC127853963 isoform X1 [Dreissena polymorpha]XP_052244799.1 uncharacterized protein LOC127853963 isoform X1 [Dreissena polymorpha]